MGIREKLYLSTVGSDACEVAERYGLGLEIADFCTASNMDRDYEVYGAPAIQKMKSASRFVFHGPFSELSPASIDPLALEVTRRRYRQAITLAESLGINRVVLHTGFIPLVYFPEWAIARSIEFWREFLRELPENIEILLENVMESSPDLQREIAKGVDDPRFCLCLDIGHANVTNSEVPVSDWIEALSPWLRHVHIHNNDGRSDLHQSLGEGILRVPEIIREIQTAAPEATFTIEAQKVAPSVLFLEENRLL